jgi:hypothetical protein
MFKLNQPIIKNKVLTCSRDLTVGWWVGGELVGGGWWVGGWVGGLVGGWWVVGWWVGGGWCAAWKAAFPVRRRSQLGGGPLGERALPILRLGGARDPPGEGGPSWRFSGLRWSAGFGILSALPAKGARVSETAVKFQRPRA